MDENKTIDDMVEVMDFGRDNIKRMVKVDNYIALGGPKGCAVIGGDPYVLSMDETYYTLVKKNFRGQDGQNRG